MFLHSRRYPSSPSPSRPTPEGSCRTYPSRRSCIRMHMQYGASNQTGGKPMENWLKRGQDETEVVAADKKVRDTVENILADIANRGDAAGRELSVKFDKWDRDDYRLTESEIEGCLSQLSKRDIEDINF